jgi:flagellar basal-body rod protein FlgG
MPRALWTGANGMVAQQTNVDVIANNIANVNTNGFKRQRVNFQDLFYDTPTNPGVRNGDAGRNPTGTQIGNGVRLSGTPRIFTPGNIEETGAPFDMAIDGEGFFAVTLNDGTTAYTRAGDFRPDADGRLVTPDGLYLDPNITVPTGATQFAVSPSGEVSVVLPNTVDPQVIGNITITRFINPPGLLAIGRNLFQESAASGDPEVGTPTQNGFGYLRGGTLEKANVEVVTELVNLIVAQRAYEMNSKSIKTSDEMMRTANEIIR